MLNKLIINQIIFACIVRANLSVNSFM